MVTKRASGPILLPCAGKSRTFVGTSELLRKGLIDMKYRPLAGSRVVRIDLLRFLDHRILDVVQGD